MANDALECRLASRAAVLDEDRELVRAAWHDTDAAGRLYDKYYSAIFGYILHCTFDHALTEDLTSNVFLAAFGHLRRFQWRRVPFGAWLYRIATNEVRMHYRRARRASAVRLEDRMGYRMESFQGGAAQMTAICNIAEKKMVVLMPSAKQYALRDLSGEDMAEIAEKQADGMDPKALVSRLLSDAYTEIGRKTIDGVEAVGVEIHNPSSGRANVQVDRRVMRLWVSIETGYPVRMESETVSNNGKLRVTQMVDQFEWHVELDPGLFELDIPSNYTEMEEPPFRPGQGDRDA